MVKLTKQLPDGRFVFCREGAYFVLTLEDIEDLNEIVAEVDSKRDSGNE